MKSLLISLFLLFPSKAEAVADYEGTVLSTSAGRVTRQLTGRLEVANAVATKSTHNVVLDGSGQVKAGVLRVTSTATVEGNAFSVGGSTFVVTSGNVGIGTSDPAVILDLRTESANRHIQVRRYVTGTAAGAPGIFGYRARGTTASPTGVLDNYRLAEFGAGGLDDSGNWVTNAYSLWTSSGAFLSNSGGAYYRVFVSSSGAANNTPVERFRVDYNGIDITGTGIVRGQLNVVNSSATIGTALKVRDGVTMSTADVSQYIDLTGFNSSISPAAGVARLHAKAKQGFTRLELHNEGGHHLVYARDNVFIARNTSGSGMTDGQAVYVTGDSGGTPTISLAKADSTTTLPADGIIFEDISNNAFGNVMRLGLLEDLDLSAFSAGDDLWVSTSIAGALTNVRPPYPYFAQRMGTVNSNGVGNGEMLVVTAPFVGGVEPGTNAPSFKASSFSALGVEGAYSITSATGIYVASGEVKLATGTVLRFSDDTFLVSAAGAVGASGATGASGASGASGVAGASGATGASGAQGLSGASGATGLTGDSGATGAAGASGAQGASGASGSVGATGNSGAGGSAGASGASGAAGQAGASGATGATGASGASGASGAQGLTGDSGATGATGASGAAGATGASGVSGSSGATGSTGAAGNTGASGATGNTGNSGATGNTGASGATGNTGNSGATGATGATGASGASNGWTADGTNVYVTDTADKVGIGTTNPSTNLEVAAGGAAIRATASGTQPSLQLWSTYNTAAERNWELRTSYAAIGDFGIRTGSTQNGAPDTTRIYIKGDGFVGIGTTSPSTALDVNGTVTATLFSGTLSGYESGETTITANSTATVTHSLGAVPKIWSVVARCKTAEQGYAVGDEIAMPPTNVSGQVGWKAGVNSTQMYMKVTGASSFAAPNSANSADVALTMANWKLIFRAYK